MLSHQRATAAQADDAEDVTMPFRIPIPSGHSAFTIPVPMNYIRSNPPRRFFFNHLEIIPDFFSMEAEKLELDADPQLDKMVERDIVAKIYYSDPKTVYGIPYEHNASAWNTPNFLKHINKHFETHKPDFAYTTPVFIDWIDQVLERNEASKDYVPNQTLVFYGEDYDKAKHFDALPPSAREVDGANNFLPPVNGAMAPSSLYEQRIRLRLWMAPFTLAVFSNINLMSKGLGFKPEDLGVPKGRQMYLFNDSAYWKVVATAIEAPKIELAVNPFKLWLRASETTNTSRIKHVAMLQKDWLDNVKVGENLAEAFRQTSRSFNLIFSLSYNSTSKTFAINFPEDSSAVNVSIVCEPEFAHRLGYGYETLITKGMKAKPQKERHSVKDAHLSALSVVFDTGPIICQLDQVSSNTTSGLIDKTVASLYPHRSGTLRMPPMRCSCALQSPQGSQSFRVWINAHTTEATYPVKFLLKRIYDDGSCLDFKWTSDAFVYGVLQGTCCQPSKSRVHPL